MPRKSDVSAAAAVLGQYRMQQLTAEERVEFARSGGFAAAENMTAAQRHARAKAAAKASAEVRTAARLAREKEERRKAGRKQ